MSILEQQPAGNIDFDVLIQTLHRGVVRYDEYRDILVTIGRYAPASVIEAASEIPPCENILFSTLAIKPLVAGAALEGRTDIVAKYKETLGYEILFCSFHASLGGRVEILEMLREFVKKHSLDGGYAALLAAVAADKPAAVTWWERYIAENNGERNRRYCMSCVDHLVEFVRPFVVTKTMMTRIVDYVVSRGLLTREQVFEDIRHLNGVFWNCISHMNPDWDALYKESLHGRNAWLIFNAIKCDRLDRILPILEHEVGYFDRKDLFGSHEWAADRVFAAVSWSKGTLEAILEAALEKRVWWLILAMVESSKVKRAGWMVDYTIPASWGPDVSEPEDWAKNRATLDSRIESGADDRLYGFEVIKLYSRLSGCIEYRFTRVAR